MGKKKSANNKRKGKNRKVTPAPSDSSQVESFKQKGNDAFAKKEYETALEAYTHALKLIESAPDAALEATIYLNRSLVYNSMGECSKAEKDCSHVLESNPLHSKALYRRAQAREQLAATVEGSLEILSAAKADLELCEKELKKHNSNADPAVTAAKIRVQKSIVATNNSPPVAKQRSDVLELLHNRRKCLEDLSNGKKLVVLQGEAFFMVDWRWWCHWCEYTGLASEVHCLLLPGACIPELGKDDKNYDDDKSTGDTEGPPGPIDNDRLMLRPLQKIAAKTTSRDAFRHDWYQSFPKSEGDNAIPQLCPNLVRGYHYELIPREVYSALRTWYGEYTESLCCRAKGDGTISIYSEKRVLREKEGGTSCSACGASHASSRCCQCMTTTYCNRLCQESHWPVHKRVCKKASETVAIAGRVGLNNLGNTCFMNSALQCLSHTTPMSRLFLSGRFKSDLNPKNPLGTTGKLASAYHSMLKEIWWTSRGSTSPIALKRSIAQFAPRFAGYGQHDAQEFLAYLLDGLHEDLNRILKAPYVEMPDVTNEHDMAVSGARAWAAHCRRNDSLVLDTFYGQFKSTCVCPHCNRVSVSFDAFNHECTCREVSEQIYKRVAYVVEGHARRDDLKIRIHTSRGQPMFLFPGDQIEDLDKTDVLPEDLDDPLKQYISEDTFVFFSLDWGVQDESDLETESFVRYNTHESWVHVERKILADAASRSPVTLDRCFDAFTKPERLDAQNKWYCSTCKDHVQAMKTMELWRLPNVLIVHLKRFEFKNILRRDKLDTLVDFPLDSLDMTQHCAKHVGVDTGVDDEFEAHYDLFAVVNHYGRLGSGHYTAFARTWDESSLSPDWSLFDDSNVRPVANPEKSIVSPAAYVLFYRRRLFH